MKKEVKNQLIEMFNNYDNLKSWLELEYYLNNESFDSSEELREYMEDRIREQEIIYYASAMDYLSSNDNSLNYSINVALELGYELKNINSEVLASLLLQENLIEELINFINEVDEEEIFND